MNYSAAGPGGRMGNAVDVEAEGVGSRPGSHFFHFNGCPFLNFFL